MSHGPFDVEPIQQYRTEAQLHHDGDTIAAARAYWRTTLAGIELGAFDQSIVDWAERTWDQPTMWVLADLLERAREQGAADERAALAREHAPGA